MKKQKLVLVGNGMAGVHCIEEIVRGSLNQFEITIFGSEPHMNYNRILLSSVLQGSTAIEDIIIRDRSWYEKHHIELFTGETVVHINTEKQTIKTDRAREVTYDKLIIATGSVPFFLPIPGIEKEGVMTFRTIDDCQKIIDASTQYKKATVIGGGVLGLEAARGLMNLGMAVDVVHLSLLLMERQLDRTASELLQKELERQGMRFLLGKETKEIIGNSRVAGIRFTDGTEIDTDFVVMATGIRSNIQLAKDCGIETNRAIVVNDYLQTSVPNIYAVGECAEHRGTVYGLVKPLYEQGKVLANHICGISSNGYEGTVLSTQLKISGVDVFSVGQLTESETTKTLKIYDEVDGVYKKAVFQEQKLVGAVMFGDTKESMKLLDMIIKQKDVSTAERANLFQPSGAGGSSIVAMAHHDIVCNCNGVSKGSIIEAVQQKELTTVEEVKGCTKASSSCGGCQPLVAELLAYIQSDEFDEIIEQKPMCTCTDMTEEEVVQEMQVRSLSSVEEVLDVLEWRHSEGCSKCRPALEYYLGMIDPEYESHQETFFINQRINAIAQSDGTYTVIPQMYGGLTTVEQLRQVTNAAEQYRLTNIAITSEQRIHLMGVKKEDLLGLCSDLNMPLSSAYGNMVQNIKTCIGEHVCQCDKQPSLALAVSLEKRLEHLRTPYRIKMGVSSCLHNGAGSTTKDVGVTRIDRGWEIYVGGSSGRNVRSGELLCVADTDEDAMDMITGFIQYYRETANYMERTWQWVERVGLIHVREVLFDPALRQQLLERLDEDRMWRKNGMEKSSVITTKRGKG